nr:hypothetical protein [Pandoravirus massiliensis]
MSTHLALGGKRKQKLSRPESKVGGPKARGDHEGARPTTPPAGHAQCLRVLTGHNWLTGYFVFDYWSADHSQAPVRHPRRVAFFTEGGGGRKRKESARTGIGSAASAYLVFFSLGDMLVFFRGCLLLLYGDATRHAPFFFGIVHRHERRQRLADCSCCS